MGIAEDIARLETSLRELITKYEQYFFGIEKREPLKLLDEVERLARQYQSANITNTRQRYKFDSLLGSLSVHKQKWSRINRLIEDGKYERDRFRMALHDKKGAQRPDTRKADHQQQEIDTIYQQYLEARKACNLPVENVSRQQIAEAIERQTPAILAKYHCSEIRFVVVIENGKPRLKARPKTS